MPQLALCPPLAARRRRSRADTWASSSLSARTLASTWVGATTGHTSRKFAARRQPGQTALLGHHLLGRRSATNRSLAVQQAWGPAAPRAPRRPKPW